MNRLKGLGGIIDASVLPGTIVAIFLWTVPAAAQTETEPGKQPSAVDASAEGTQAAEPAANEASETDEAASEVTPDALGPEQGDATPTTAPTDPTAPVTAQPYVEAPTETPSPRPPPMVHAESDLTLAPEARRYLDEIRPFFDGASLREKNATLKTLEGATDPAAGSALRYIAENDNDARVSAEATRVLGTLENPEAFAALGRLARISRRALVWKAAVEALGTRGNEAAGEALFALAADEDLRTATRRLAIATLSEHYPELAARRGTPRIAGSRAVPALAGAFFGGYTLFTVGQFALSDAGPAIGAVGGSLIGATTGFLLAQNLTTDRSLFYSSAMGWGLADGLLLINATSRFPDSRLRLAAGVLGELVGAGAAYVVADALDFSAEQLVFININGMAGAMLGTGLGWINDSREFRVTPALALLGSLAGLGVAGWGAKWASFTHGDLLLSTWAAMEGGWLGAWMPTFTDGVDVWGSFWVGSTLGLFAGETVAHFVDLSSSDVGQMAMLSVFGKSLGSGLALLGQGSLEVVTATQLVVGAGGLALGALLRDQLKYTTGDATAIPVATALGLWHGLALGGVLLDRETIDGGQFGGLSLTVPALFGLAAVAATQFIDPTPWEVAMGSMGALWGAWFVAWSAALGSWDLNTTLLGTLAGSDVGLLLTAVLISPLVAMDPMIVAGASVGGVVATGLATLVAAMLTENPNTLMATNLAASGIGLLAGGLLSWTMVRDRPRGEPARAAAGNPPKVPDFILSFQPATNSKGEIDGAMLAITIQG